MNIVAAQVTVSLPKPWLAFLKEVDAALSEPVTLQCLGGFVLTALYGLPRYTGDLDYIQVIPREAADQVEKIGGRESALCKKHRLFLQGVGGIADLPAEYESRLQQMKLENMEKLKLSALDPYDLLLSKISRNSPKDQEDAKYLIPKLKLEFEPFQNRWQQEVIPWVATNHERHDLSMQLWKDYFPKP